MRQGSTGNVIAALVSFFIPGLGQLIQGRILACILMLIILGICYLCALLTFGVALPLFHGIAGVIACIDAARWKGRSTT
jgi:TM2 domain-containing membrane protein YozV